MDLAHKKARNLTKNQTLLVEGEVWEQSLIKK